MKKAAEPLPPPPQPGSHVPEHVAIIMDGNGRWAKSHGLPRVIGHKRGAETLRHIMEACQQLGLHYLTIYAFSSENWKRPVWEVSDLMELLRHYLDREIMTLHKRGVRLRVIGDRTRLASDIRSQIDKAEALTSGNATFNLTVALSYGARQEMIHAMKTLAARLQDGSLTADAITEETVSSLLYTAGIPDPDMIIRTGGEQRLSNFLLWQSAYSELYFTPVFWPDFTETHLREALGAFASRERRYGTTGE